MYSYLFRLQMSQRDFEILERIVADQKPKSKFRKRIRKKILLWAFKYQNGDEFLTENEWKYLRSMYYPVLNPVKKGLQQASNMLSTH